MLGREPCVTGAQCGRSCRRHCLGCGTSCDTVLLKVYPTNSITERFSQMQMLIRESAPGGLRLYTDTAGPEHTLSCKMFESLFLWAIGWKMDRKG